MKLKNNDKLQSGSRSGKGQRTTRLIPDDPITQAVNRLGRLCGMGKGELDTEEFVEKLSRCVSATIRDIEESNAEGLGLDATRVLGYRLGKLNRRGKS
jgi:hypothetical protein